MAWDAAAEAGGGGYLDGRALAMAAPAAVKAVAAAASARPARRRLGSAAARASIDAAWHPSIPAPAASTFRRGCHSVRTAWARWRAPRIRTTALARELEASPVQR